MKDSIINLEDMRRLLELFDRNSLAEMQIQEGDLEVTLRRETTLTQGTIPSGLPVLPQISAPQVSSPVEESPAEQVFPDNAVTIESPTVGIFYTSPSPDSEPFIHVGDKVSEGQTIGMIEAMKVFSEIPSETSGTVLAIPASNGELVQQGQALLILEP